MMTKLATATFAFLLTLNVAYAADEEPTVIASAVLASNAEQAPALPSLGDEPTTQTNAEMGWLGKAFVAAGVAVATYYLINNDDGDGYAAPTLQDSARGPVAQAVP